MEAQRPKISQHSTIHPALKDSNLFFVDGLRRVDYILVYNATDKNKEKNRKVFERKLVDEGLEIEHDEQDDCKYVKVHAPWEVLSRYAETMKLRMPIRQKFGSPEKIPATSNCQWLTLPLTKLMSKLMSPFQLDPMEPIPEEFTHVFERDKEYLFAISEKKELFFSNAQRSQIVNYILRRKEYSEEPEESLWSLVQQAFREKCISQFYCAKRACDEASCGGDASGLYTAAYPLHEGSWKPGTEPSMRRLLYEHWARWKCFYKLQPLDYIRKYFGEKIALYFAWLGFYTFFLIPASVVGLIVFIYGIATMQGDIVSNEICYPEEDYLMCPKCDQRCPYWNYSSVCYYARWSHVFDNNATVFFSIFMSLWCVLFLEFWKREQACIQFKWNLMNFQEEEEPGQTDYLKLKNSKFKKCNNESKESFCKTFVQAASAIETGDTETLKKLLEQGLRVKQKFGWDEETLLHVAARSRKKQFEAVRLLAGELGAKVDLEDGQGEGPIDLEDREGKTPLHVAVTENRLEAVKLLAGEYQANIHLEDNKGMTPIDRALWYHSYTIADVLIERNTRPKLYGMDTDELVKYMKAASAIENGDTETFRELLDKGLHVNQTFGLEEETLLHVAVSMDQRKAVRLLAYELGADVHLKDRQKVNPIKLALDDCSYTAAAILIEHSTRPTLYGMDRHKLVKYMQAASAIETGDTKTLKELLDKGLDVNQTFGPEEVTLLHVAVSMKLKKGVRMLADKLGADVPFEDNGDVTLLHVAVINNWLEAVKLLVDKYQANIHSEDNEGMTPIDRALWNHSYTTAAVLIKHNTRPKLYGMVRHELVKYMQAASAIETGDTETLGELLDKDLHTNQTFGQEELVKYMQAYAGRTLGELLDKDLHVNQTFGQEELEYIYAGSISYRERRHQYLDIGLHVNQTFGPEEVTLLHVAVIKEQLEAVRLLAGELGAEVHMGDYDGWDTIDWALQLEDCSYTTAAVLIEYSTRPELWITDRHQVEEPYAPFLPRKIPITASFSIMCFSCLVPITVVIGMIVFRMSLRSMLYAQEEELVYKNAAMITTATTACINFIFIFILDKLYWYMAVKLTNWECLRTETEYDNSLSFKLYTLKFVNFYSSLFYIAFFKGRYKGRPGDYNKLFGARQEECAGGGCLIELCIQLAIIFVGYQLIQNNLLEIFWPQIKVRIKRRLKKWIKSCKDLDKAAKQQLRQWEKDYKLEELNSCGVFDEYLEMLIQFGFVTLFVAAFPLAPLFALVNNIIEIRIDANKFVRQLRRPTAVRAENIGIWYDLLQVVSRISILCNACIIAFTSDFINRLVYTYVYSDGSLHGYVNNSLSYFNVSDFTNSNRPIDPEGKFNNSLSYFNVSDFKNESAPYMYYDHKGKFNSIDICRYRDYRVPPWEEDKYAFTTQFWHVLAAKFIFVIIFQNVVMISCEYVAYLIPDMPRRVRELVRHENHLTNEIILKEERNKTKNMEPKNQTDDKIRRRISRNVDEVQH